MSDITSRPYQPNPAKCCEGCVFNGPHQPWCSFMQEEEYFQFLLDWAGATGYAE